MKRVLLVLLACAGCDKLFSIDHLDLAIDAPRSVDADIPTCLGGDEDCDGRGNSADFCPADADAPADDDADGVGNACDPDAMGNEPNHLEFFDGFDDNTGNWSIKSGNWNLSTKGVFRQPDVGDTRVEKTVTMKFPTLELVIPELTTVNNGSVTAFGSDNGSDLRCSLYKRSSDGAEFLEIAGLLIPAKQVSLNGTGTIRLVGGQYQNGEFYCRARHGTNFDTEVRSGLAGPITIDTIGFATSSASTTIASATLFDVQ